MSAIQDEEFELAEDLRHHSGEGEALRKGGVGQVQVLVGEDLQHAVVLVVGADLDGIVVITVEDLPVEGFGRKENIVKNGQGLSHS